MIRIKRLHKTSNDYVYHYVLENEEEWKAYSKKHNVQCKEPEIAEVGDFLFLDTSYYVPILFKQEQKRAHGRYIVFTLPNTFVKIYINNKDNKTNRCYYNYNPHERLLRPDTEYGKERIVAVANLMKLGIPIYEAFATIFPQFYTQPNRKSKFLKKLKGFINNDNVMRKLFDYGIIGKEYNMQKKLASTVEDFLAINLKIVNENKHPKELQVAAHKWLSEYYSFYGKTQEAYIKPDKMELGQEEYDNLQKNIIIEPGAKDE